MVAPFVDRKLKFGPQYLIPKPFDLRLIEEIAPAVAKAAMDSGVSESWQVASWEVCLSQKVLFG